MIEKEFQQLIKKLENLYQPFEKMNRDQVQAFSLMWKHEKHDTVDRAIVNSFISDIEYKAKRIIPPPGIIQRYINDIKESSYNNNVEPLPDVPLNQVKYNLFFLKCMMGLLSAKRRTQQPSELLTYKFSIRDNKHCSFVDLFVMCYNDFGYKIMTHEKYLTQCYKLLPQLPEYIKRKLREPEVEEVKLLDSVPF